MAQDALPFPLRFPGSGQPDWRALHDAAAGCKACDLWKRGTQTVFGEGNAKSKIMFVGEQPGNDEDLAGKPFVGPAGRLLGQALERAGIDRGLAYVTNVVKHFKWEPRGKRRIHAKPNAAEITACLPRLQAEIDWCARACSVCLGATAAQALLGRQFRVTAQRGASSNPAGAIRDGHGPSLVDPARAG
jgi:DNA polymerase